MVSSAEAKFGAAHRDLVNETTRIKRLPRKERKSAARTVLPDYVARFYDAGQSLHLGSMLRTIAKDVYINRHPVRSTYRAHFEAIKRARKRR